MRKSFVAVTVACLSVAVWVACGGSGDNSGFTDGTNEAGTSSSSGSFGPGDDGGSSGSLSDGSLGTCEKGCNQGAVCKYSVCIPNLGSCTSNDTCPGDSYCDPADNTCVPYGVPPGKVNDPSCAKPIAPGNIEPTVQCEWDGPGDAGDPTKDYRSVYSAPMVADLNLDLDPNKLQPSVVLTTWTNIHNNTTNTDERIGMLRVFDGRTCAEQMRIGGPDDPEREFNRPGYGTQWAIGDLDNDVGTPNGHPEIVGMQRTTDDSTIGTNPPLALVAFKIAVTNGVPRLERKWRGRICATDGGADQIVTFGNNQNNYGPGIWDLDDDGKPEVVLDMNVFDANGCLLNPPAQFAPYLDHGSLSTVADVDLDGKPDLVRANGIYGWNTVLKTWELKPYFTQRARPLPKSASRGAPMGASSSSSKKFGKTAPARSCSNPSTYSPVWWPPCRLPDCTFCGILACCRVTPLFDEKSSPNHRPIPPKADRPLRRATNSPWPPSETTMLAETMLAQQHASAGRGCSRTSFVPTSTPATDAADRCAGSRPRSANPPSHASWPNTVGGPDLRPLSTAPSPVSSSYPSRAEPSSGSSERSGPSLDTGRQAPGHPPRLHAASPTALACFPLSTGSAPTGGSSCPNTWPLPTPNTPFHRFVCLLRLCPGEELGSEHVLASRSRGRALHRATHLALLWRSQDHGRRAVGQRASDSISDLPMLERVGEPYVVNRGPAAPLAGAPESVAGAEMVTPEERDLFATALTAASVCLA